MKSVLHALIIAAFASIASAADAPSPPPPGPEKKDAILEQARGAIEQKDWARAQGVLRGGLAKNARNADYHNLYAYSVRNGAHPDMAVVFRHYNEALRIDPQHVGAHEYLGEAYLLSGNTAKAKEHLGQLARICGSCAEASRLKKAIATFEQAKY